MTDYITSMPVALRGCRMIPLRPGTKQPAAGITEARYEEGGRWDETVDAYLSRGNRVGIFMGGELVGLDSDIKATWHEDESGAQVQRTVHGDEVLADLLYQAGITELPRTLTIRTQGGGTHRYFRQNRNAPVTQTAFLALDVRAHRNGYLAIGDGYELIDDADGILAELPETLALAMMARLREPGSEIARLDTTSTAQTHFNNALAKVKGAMVQMGWPEEQANEAIRRLNEVSDDPMDLARLEGTVLRLKGWEPGAVVTDGMLAWAEKNAAPAGRLITYTPGEMLSDPHFLDPPTWDIQGWWVAGTHGQVGGAEKSFKSWLEIWSAVSMASGRPMLGILPVVRQAPVAVLTGEGSRRLWLYRAWQIAQVMGMGMTEFKSLPLHVSDTILSFSGQEFLSEARKLLVSTGASKLIIDPLYAYMGADAEPGNVFQMGQRLASVSYVTGELGVSLEIVHHLTKAGSRDSCPWLTDLTQAGSREWVHSWILADTHHASDDHVYTIHLNAGGRDWDGCHYTLVTDHSQFDRAALKYKTPPTWELREGKPPRTDGDKTAGTALGQKMAEATDISFAFEALRRLGPGDWKTADVVASIRRHKLGTLSADDETAAKDVRNRLNAHPDVTAGGSTKGRFWSL